MKIGDLVKNLNSESRMTGIVIAWSDEPGQPHVDLEGCQVPVVMWEDGRTNWIVRSRAEVINETR